MKKVYIIYEGNSWLSNSSLVPMGIFDDMCILLEKANELVGNNYGYDYEIVDDILDELSKYNQASGYGDVSYLIKEVELNKIEEF